MKFSRFKNNKRFRKKTLQGIKHFIIEFILIFLGVLLALQFDQYESDKSMEKQKLRYEKELLKELRHDKNLLSYSKRLLVENVDYLSQIEKRIKNNSSIDTIIKIVRSELDFKSYVYGVTYNDVFKSMVYEDDVWLLDQEIISKLKKLDLLREEFKNVVSINSHSFSDIGNYFMKKYPSNRNNIYGIVLRNQIWENLDEVDFLTRFNALISGMKNYNESVKTSLNAIIEEDKKLIELLRNRNPKN